MFQNFDLTCKVAFQDCIFQVLISIVLHHFFPRVLLIILFSLFNQLLIDFQFVRDFHFNFQKISFGYNQVKVHQSFFQYYGCQFNSAVPQTYLIYQYCHFHYQFTEHPLVQDFQLAP